MCVTGVRQSVFNNKESGILLKSNTNRFVLDFNIYTSAKLSKVSGYIKRLQCCKLLLHFNKVSESCIENFLCIYAFGMQDMTEYDYI